MNLEGPIAAIKDALLADERISAAILFGSAAKGVARPSSDLDVAVIASSPGAAQALKQDHLDLVGTLTHAAGREVHLVLLDCCEPVLGRQAFLGSRVLFDRNPSLTADVLERILIEYFDGEYHRRMRAEALERRRELRRG